MLNKIRENSKILIIFIEILLIFLGFWFLLNNLTTNGIWETVVLNILFFLVFPWLILKQGWIKSEIEQKINFKVCLQILIFWIIFLVLILKSDYLSFIKLNYLSRIDWFLNDWWMIFFIDLILVPLILFSQEFFFRNFLINKLMETFSTKMTLVIQAGFFVFFEILFFEIFSWQFILFSFFLALFLGWLYTRTKSIWYSFVTRWALILLLDGVILYKIQKLKL